MNAEQDRTFSPCTIPICNSESNVLCRCCKQNCCVEHLIEHTDNTSSDLNYINDEINKLDNEIKRLNIQPIIENCRQKLEQWRLECHRNIDQYFQRKLHELYRFVDEKIDDQRIDIHYLKSKRHEFTNKRKDIYHQEAELLKSIIDDIRIELDTMNELYKQVNTYPLSLHENLIHIDNRKLSKLNSSSLLTVHMTINHPQGGCGILTSNDKYMLAYLAPKLILIDKRIHIIDETVCPYHRIVDMCWSSTIDRFILIERDNIYLVNHRDMSIEDLQIIKKHQWFSCTCSDTSLFLSVNEKTPSIIEYHVSPSIKLVNEWKSPYVCIKNESIDHISYQNSTLALIISNKIEKSVRIELRSSQTLERIWSLQLDTLCHQNRALRCCTINSNEWLLADYQNSRLIYVTQNGNVKTIIPYKTNPCHLVLFHSNLLAISRNNGINFHKL